MAIENRKVFNYSVYALGAVLWAGVIWRLFNSLVGLLPPEYSNVGGFPLVNLMGPLTFLLTGAACEIVRRDERAYKFGVEVIAELKKVTWPNWNDIRGSTLIVLVMTLIVSFVLFIFDKIFDWGLTLLW